MSVSVQKSTYDRWKCINFQATPLLSSHRSHTRVSWTDCVVGGPTKLAVGPLLVLVCGCGAGCHQPGGDCLEVSSDSEGGLMSIAPGRWIRRVYVTRALEPPPRRVTFGVDMVDITGGILEEVGGRACAWAKRYWWNGIP